VSPKERLVPGKVKQNDLGTQARRETLVMWGDIAPMLTRDMYVHVITDGGASPNPGSAGWGAIIRQKGKFAWNFGHCSRATNIAMELRAVFEALRNLPEDMHVWISTDSAYVKRGITERVPRWRERNWKNAKGDTISNLSQWKALLNQVDRMRAVQWTWVKAHNGYLLNECADMRATKGVRNETPCSNAQYPHPINEDIDLNGYVFADGELPVPPSD
jgi:ribonuclease HI